MVYSADGGIGKIAGIHLDQQTGKMTAKFVVNDRSFEFQPLFGSAGHRVLVTQNVLGNTPAKAFAEGSNYQETLMWLDEKTGKMLAQSTSHPATTTGSLISVGYGGRVYMMGTQGSLFIFSVAPCSGGVYIPQSIGGSTCPSSTGSPSPSASSSG